MHILNCRTKNNVKSMIYIKIDSYNIENDNLRIFSKYMILDLKGLYNDLSNVRMEGYNKCNCMHQLSAFLRLED